MKPLATRRLAEHSANHLIVALIEGMEKRNEVSWLRHCDPRRFRCISLKPDPFCLQT
jgi:hypothetical protein